MEDTRQWDGVLQLASLHIHGESDAISVLLFRGWLNSYLDTTFTPALVAIVADSAPLPDGGLCTDVMRISVRDNWSEYILTVTNTSTVKLNRPRMRQLVADASEELREAMVGLLLSPRVFTVGSDGAAEVVVKRPKRRHKPKAKPWLPFVNGGHSERTLDGLTLN